jgi:hypothetical protein
MARPVQPIVPADPLLIVDGRTPFVAHSPVMLDIRTDLPLVGRSAELALLAREGAEPIHNTLRGAGVSVGDGSYTYVMQPRALWLRLAPFANKRVVLRVTIPGQPPVFTPLQIVWRAAEYPVEVAS